jgi:hypothetical protein
MNGTAFPQPDGGQTGLPSGIQVVVLHSDGDMTDPASIITNSYITVGNVNDTWGNTYQYMWDNAAALILSSGDITQQRLIVASFGLDLNMSPTAFFLDLMLNNGAGAQLQNWGTSGDPGSEGADWVQNPVNYIVVGGSSYGYGEGYEIFDNPGSSPVKTTLNVTLDNPVPATA